MTNIIEIKHRWTNGTLFSGEYASLRDAVIATVDAGANLADANLADANLAGAYLAGANLTGANLTGANLARANLAGANLADANLADANLAGANLAGANLTGANLTDANLTGANLAGANLAGAYLARANLAGANLAGAYLVGAKWRDDIILTRRPLQLYGLAYPVVILDQHMQIGCELHSLAEWAAFDNTRIARMDGKASRRFWDAHGSALLALATSDGRGVSETQATGEAA
jgi:hypothetical protein